jgi:hypothetical protein
VVLRANPYGSLTRCLALEGGTLPYAEGLLLAMNAHKLDTTVGCFADDYVKERPAHPQLEFRGGEQVRRN